MSNPDLAVAKAKRYLDVPTVEEAMAMAREHDELLGCRYICDSEGQMRVIRQGQRGYIHAYLDQGAARAAYYIPSMVHALAQNAGASGVSVTELARATGTLSQVAKDGRPPQVQVIDLNVSSTGLTPEQQEARRETLVQMGIERAIAAGDIPALSAGSECSCEEVE